MTNRLTRLLIPMVLAPALYSCQKERDPCLQPRTILLRAGAYRPADTGSAYVDTALPNPIYVALTTVTNQNAFRPAGQRNKFGFQLSAAADSCRWVVRPDSAVAVQDTLTFFYVRQLRFLSNACGYVYFFDLQRVNTTRHALDSVQISNSSVTTEANVEHLKMYY